MQKITKNLQKKPPGQIKEFSKVAGYKFNMYKLIISLYPRKKKCKNTYKCNKICTRVLLNMYEEFFVAENYKVLY